MRSLAPRLGLAFVLTAGAAMLTGCSSDVTASLVHDTFDRTFIRLYAIQQADLGRPNVRPGHFFAVASCQKGLAGSAQTGAGDNWVCVEQWQEVGGHFAEATYELSVRTDGCFEATGPADVVGGPLLEGPTGEAIVNPLAQFDACFAT